MLEDHLYWLDQIRTAHRLQVGDKAFYLSLLAQRGCPVIPGFVVSASVFQTFLEQIEWAEPMFADLPYSSLHVDVDNSRQLQAVAQQIRQTLETAPLSEEWLSLLEKLIQPWSAPAVILRPSIALPSGLDPTVSFRATGFLEAKVCNGEKHNLAQSLKQVWAELFRAKSLLYWQRLRIQPQQVNLAILVQPIANAIASGAVQVHETHLRVQAVWGLGKGLSSGEVLPDRYQVDLQTGQHTYYSASKLYAYQLAAPSVTPSDRPSSPTPCADSYVPTLVEQLQQTQPTLSEPQLQQLIHLTQQTATDLGSHLELEWTLIAGIDDEDSSPQFYLTQVTPHLRRGRWEGEFKKLDTPVHQPPHFPLSAFHSPLAAPLITGLAASPGMIAAPAWVTHHSMPSQLNMPTSLV